MSFLQPLAVEQRSSSEPSESAIQNEAAIKNEGARNAPESGQKEDKKRFSPKDVKIRKIKMSFRPG